MIQKEHKTIPAFLSGGGEMGELIRHFAWSQTALGDIAQWPPSLVNVVSIMLANRFPMILWWGNEYIQLYNDAYIPITGLKHPAGVLGLPGRIGWSEIWHIIGPLVDTPFQGGPATWMDDIQLQLNRNHFIEETHFTIAYSPVPDPHQANGIGGVLATVNEITETVIGKRQMETMGALGRKISSTLSEQQVYEQSAAIFLRNPTDIPFALIYTIAEDGAEAVLAATAGFQGAHPLLPKRVTRSTQSHWVHDLFTTVAENMLTTSENYAEWQEFPTGAWDVQAKQVVFIPIKAANKKFPIAVMVLGLNPYRKFDQGYRNFVQIIADQISLGLSTALAYQEERHRALALEELDRSKTTFFSNISHEFRTPLTLMLGMMEEVLKEPQTAPANKEKMTVAHRNALRLLKLVNMLLDFSRMESGRQKAHYVLTDVAAFTKDLAGNFRSLMEKAGLTFIVESKEDLPVMYLDRQMWEKIIFNLLSNAFKYTLFGGVTMKLFREGNDLVLTVQDSGVGIPEREIPHMFERFHRVHNSPGRSYEGSGIGLSLIKEFVELHGGAISLESKESEGSTFKITLPAGKEHLPAEQISESAEETNSLMVEAYIEEIAALMEAGPAPETPEEEAAAIEQHQNPQLSTVLVVDDNKDMRHYITALLKRHFRVITAVNGKEALDKINSQKPDLVLSDIMMPVIDGIRLVREIKRQPQTAGIPVILLTARAGEESKVEGYETGADDYLVKPFFANELIARVKSQVKNSAVRMESESRFRNMANAMPQVVWMVDENGEAIYYNDQVSNFAGGQAGTAMHWQWKNIVHPADLQATLTCWQDAIMHGTAYEQEHRIKMNDGSWRWHLSRAFPQKNAQGKITHWYGTSTDIHQQKSFAELLEEKVAERTASLEQKNIDLANAQSFLQQVIDSSVEYISVLDKEFRYITINRMFEEQLFLKKDLIRGKSIFEVIPGVRDSPVADALHKALKGTTVHLPKRKAFARPGIILDTYFVPLVIRGQTEAVVVMARNITDIINSEQLLQQKNAELERSNQELESFTYVASHDLQEPLRKIQTFIHLLDETEWKDSSRLKYAEKIIASAHFMSELINSLLDYSRLSHPTEAFRQTDLNEILDKVRTDEELLIQKSGAVIDAGHLPRVQAIALQMEQLFSNLIANAIKFCNKTPQIKISVSQKTAPPGKIAPGLDSGHLFYVIAFQDNGIGFSTDYQEQIFKPFQRLHSKSEYEGTGIGLSIVSKIADNHGGFVEAASEPGRGSTFSVWLPA